MSLTRRQFLRGDFAAKRSELRPPWALPEAEFTARCTRCESCLLACPEGIIVKGRSGFPAISFATSGCTFCGSCADACADGALRRTRAIPPWALRAHIEPSCLAFKQVVCRSCGENCDANAVRPSLAAGSVSTPRVDPDRCTGCGKCVGTCPVGAITVRELRPPHRTLEAA